MGLDFFTDDIQASEEEVAFERERARQARAEDREQENMPEKTGGQPNPAAARARKNVKSKPVERSKPKSEEDLARIPEQPEARKVPPAPKPVKRPVGRERSKSMPDLEFKPEREDNPQANTNAASVQQVKKEEPVVKDHDMAGAMDAPEEQNNPLAPEQENAHAWDSGRLKRLKGHYVLYQIIKNAYAVESVQEELEPTTQEKIESKGRKTSAAIAVVTGIGSVASQIFIAI